MSTEPPNVNVPLDNEMHALLDKFAKEESKPLPAMAASLIKEAMDMRTEDIILSDYAETRLKHIKTWHSHEEAWGS